MNEAVPASRTETFEVYLKHMGSCLPDVLFRIVADRHRSSVTILSEAFDSSLMSTLLTRILPDQHGIVAYRDDKHWVPPAPPYELKVRIGRPSTVEFSAQVVRLSSAVGADVAVRLSAPRSLTPGGD